MDNKKKLINQALDRLKQKEKEVVQRHLDLLPQVDAAEKAFHKADREAEELRNDPYFNEAWEARTLKHQAWEMAKAKVSILEQEFDRIQERLEWVRTIKKNRCQETAVNFVEVTLANVVGKIKLPADPRRQRKTRHQKEVC